MTSLRGRLVRFFIKHVLRPKFRKCGSSVIGLRRVDEYLIRNVKVPNGTVVEPVVADGIRAEWVQAPQVVSDRAILYLHGGGFVAASPATHRELTAMLSAATNARMLVLDYRLAPEHPFPAAMHDAITAYRWLLDSGYAASRLAIGGDSAGGALTLQTLLALRDEGITMPAAAVFLSPVTDMVRFDGNSYATRAKVDPLIDSQGSAAILSHYVGDNDPDTPLLSPVHMDLSRLPPLCIHVGDREVLLSDSVRLAENARAADVEVELRIWPGMWHVFQSCARLVPEARRSLDDIGRFIRHRLE